MSPHDSLAVHPHRSERSPTLPSSSGLCVRQIENEQQSTVGEVSQRLKVMALARRPAGPAAARQRCTKSPRLRQLAEWKETNKKKIWSLFLHVLVQSSYILDVVWTFWMLGSSHAFDFAWLCHLCDLESRSLCATSQRHDLWQWCNRKAIEALAGSRPTARWCCLRKLVFVRLPLLP